MTIFTTLCYDSNYALCTLSSNLYAFSYEKGTIQGKI